MFGTAVCNGVCAKHSENLKNIDSQYLSNEYRYEEMVDVGINDRGRKYLNVENGA